MSSENNNERPNGTPVNLRTNATDNSRPFDVGTAQQATQNNIDNSIHTNIHLPPGAEQLLKPPSPVEDPSEPWLMDHKTLYASYHRLVRDAREMARALARRGCLLIGCEHLKLLNAAAQAVMAEPVFSSCERRRLVLDDWGEFGIKNLFRRDNLRRIGQKEGGKTSGRNVFLVVAVSKEVDLITLRDGVNHLINPWWSDIGFYLTFTLSGAAQHRLNAVSIDSAVPVWRINAIEHIVSPQEEPCGSVAQLVQELDEYRRQRGWASGESAFLEEIELAYSDAKTDGVRSMVQQWVSQPREDKEPSQPSVLWRSAGLLEQAALFACAYFPGSSDYQFQLLMETLLEGQTLPLETAASVSTTQDAKAALTPPAMPLSALERWRVQKSTVLEKAQLTPQRASDGGIVVAFCDARMAAAIKGVISPMYVLEQFQRMDAAGLLLRADVPKPIVEGLISLTADMMVAHKDRFNADWLLDRVKDIDRWKRECDERLSQEALEQLARAPTLAAQVGVLALHLSKDGELGTILHHFYTRLAALCRGLLANFLTAEVARKFLNRLIHDNQPNGLQAVEVIRRLPEGDFYSPFEHLARVCQSGNAETCCAVMRVMLTKMEESPQTYWKVLRRVKEWLPPRDHPKTRQFSRSELWGLALPYLAFLEYLHRSGDSRASNEEVPALWLFGEHEEGLPTLSERVLFLADWLSHPAFCLSLRILLLGHQDQPASIEPARDQESGLWAFESCRAEMLEGWYSLSGDRTVQQLAEATAARLPRNEALNLRRQLRARGDALVDLVDCSSGASRQAVLSRRLNAYTLARCCETAPAGKTA